MGQNAEQKKNSDAERFELRDAPGAAGKVISSHASREEADEALTQKRQELPGVDLTIVDRGVQAVPENEEQRSQAIENGKTAEQKRIEKDQQESRFAESAAGDKDADPTLRDRQAQTSIRQDETGAGPDRNQARKSHRPGA